jgi:hypothetical protein
MASRPAAGGGRWVDVAPQRLAKWCAGFQERHGAYVESVEAFGVTLTAADGAVAQLHAPPGISAVGDLGALTDAANDERRFGLLLARAGAVAVAIADGGRLAQTKVDSSYVQGRTAAGGWSQQRFARRRGNQAKAAAGGAADIVARILLPVADELTTVVTGGDRRAVDAVLADKRLTPISDRRAGRFLDVGEPRYAALEKAVELARAVRIRVLDSPSAAT